MSRERLESKGKKEGSGNSGSMFGQYNNLQNLISMLSPKNSTKLERKKSDKRDHPESVPVIKKVFLEESKIPEVEELESPLIKRYKYKKTLMIETPQSDSPPDKSEIESKSGSIRLMTTTDQTRVDIDDSNSIIDIVISYI